MRALEASEIEVRVGTCNPKGVSLLLYKDSRCDMRILDEIFGTFGWTNEYKQIGGELYCTVTVYDKENNIWVSKQSNGSPSNMEAEKGRASDALKRACFLLGIGRELYTAPFIWVPADKCNIQMGKNARNTCYDKFRCEKIRTENGIITGLSIFNDTTGHRVFVYTQKN